MNDGHDRKRRRVSPEDVRRPKHPPSGHRSAAASLPFGAIGITTKDLDHYRALFGLYLDMQKKLDIDELERTELKGRFKSFVGKWNRGELAEGWYDPGIKLRAATVMGESDPPPTRANKGQTAQTKPDKESSDDEDDYGPTLGSDTKQPRALGPTYARADDLQSRDEQRRDDEQQRHKEARDERKLERKARKERLDELAPRAEPGTKERQLEKKRETAAANRQFRDAKEPETEEVGDSQLMGDGGLEGYKAKMQAQQKKKSERELRKEEALRAREGEREEKMAKHRAKEAKTMDMLKALAQRFE